MAMQQQQHQQAQQGGGNNQGPAAQMNPQQLQTLQQAQMAAAAAAQQAHQQQRQQNAAAHQQNQQAQTQAQPPAQPQQSQPNPQMQAPPAQPQNQQAGMQQQQQQAAVTAAMLQRQQGEKLKGQCLMKLMQFGDHLSNFAVSSRPIQAHMHIGTQRLFAQGTKQQEDLNYWQTFVDRFFSQKGVLRHSVWLTDEKSNKEYEITQPALARYFHTHFEGGVKNMQLIMEKGSEKELPNHGHYVESPKSSFVYWFDNGSQVRAQQFPSQA